ncbi:MAG: ParB/RepB/Spo0J family partition protein [Candidatus Neomarinimicrobiota bacterium]
MSNKRLGKGLEALIPPKDEPKSRMGTLLLRLSEILPNPHQPRQSFNKVTLSELAASIKAKGIITPITVRVQDNKFILVAGERRLRAARIAGLVKVPAFIVDVSDGADMMEMALIENIQRENLNAIEEAEVFALLHSKFELSQEKIAHSVGKKRVTISNSLRLLSLPDEIKTSLRKGVISAGHGRAILMMKSKKIMMKVWKRIVKENLSVRGAETLANNLLLKSKSTKKQLHTTKPTEDPGIQAMENELIEILGTKINIRTRGKGGVIEVSYFSDDDFDRIYHLITSIQIP